MTFTRYGYDIGPYVRREGEQAPSWLGGAAMSDGEAYTIDHDLDAAGTPLAAA
jgi:hypothetical protein